MTGVQSRSRRKRGKGMSLRALLRRGTATQSIDEQRERLVSEGELDRLLTAR